MNVYDSVRMADVLAPLGYGRTDTPETADLVILNTCHIREKASEKLYSDLGRLRVLRDRRRNEGKSGDGVDSADGADPADDMIIAVAGCVAQAEGAEIMRRAPQVDIVFGPQAYHRLPEMIARANRAVARRRPRGAKSGHGVGILETDFPAESKFDNLPKIPSSQGPSAFLTVQEGCDKFCAFCVVPYTRGAEYSRPVSQILQEARGLVAAGAREITLLGQNVNAYHGEALRGGEWGLGRLVRELAEIDGLERIRYTTSHPRDVDDDLIAAHRDVAKLMPYLHLPVQSGSDRVLAAMNRQHVAEDYLAIVDRLRAARPDLAFSSDFIVGHPGETEQDFEATMRLIRDVGFVQAYSFKYSPRPGTPAAAIPDQVPADVKDRRLAELQALLSEQQQAFNKRFAGGVLPVLFDRRGRGESQLAGRSPYMQAVHVDLEPADLSEPGNGVDRLFGSVVSVRIREAHTNSLAGVLDNESPAGLDRLPLGPEPVRA